MRWFKSKAGDNNHVTAGMEQAVCDAVRRLSLMKTRITKVMETYPEDEVGATHDKYCVLHALLELIQTWELQLNPLQNKAVFVINGRQYARFENAKLFHPKYADVRLFSQVSETGAIIQSATPLIELVKSAAHIELIKYESKWSWQTLSPVLMEK